MLAPKLSHLLLFGSMFAASALGGCDVAGDLADLAGPIANTDNYVMNTTCKDTTPLEACDTCCEGLGFDLAIVATGDCGCASQNNDSERCKDSASSIDECSKCCESDPTNLASSRSGGVCTCRGISKTPNPETTGNHDGCTTSGQTCTCSNTGSAGTCGTGTAKSGLYCQCD